MECNNKTFKYALITYTYILMTLIMLPRVCDQLIVVLIPYN